MRSVQRRKEENDHDGKRQKLFVSEIVNVDSGGDYTNILNAIGEKMQSMQTTRHSLGLTIYMDHEENEKLSASQISAASRDATDAKNKGEVAHNLNDEQTVLDRREKSFRRHSFRGGKHTTEDALKKGLEGEDVETVGIFGSSSTPISKWGLSGYLHSVASTREKRVVAVSAWLVALIGLIVALTFVTKDFLESKDELASTTHYIDEEEMQLPSLWFCTLGTEINPFADFPTDEYKGQPLLWIDTIYGLKPLEKMMFPETHLLQQLEIISVNVMGKPCKGLKKMDPKTFTEENARESICFYCLSISRQPAVELSVHHGENEGAEEKDEDEDSERSHKSSDRVGFRLSRHSLVTSCRTNAMGISRNMLSFFREEIKKHHAGLTEKGILDFGGLDPTQGASDGYLWPNYRLGYNNVTVDRAVLDVVDMFCNVYLFSGFFYPSTAQDVKYRFNTRLFLWERSGLGPYAPANFSRFQGKKGVASAPTSNSRILGQETFENTTVLASNSLHILTNESHRGRAETLTALEPNHMASIRLSRSIVRGKESFQTAVLRTTLDKGDVRVLNYVYYVDVSFKSSLTQVVSDQMTVSWPAFIADFLGLTSLFLDFSVYTLIVSPLIVRAKKRAVVARKVGNS